MISLTAWQRDPEQLHNLATAELLSYDFEISGRNIKDVIVRLDALMMVLKSCKASSCTDPWKVLHPQGNVADLPNALASDFDIFYEHQPKVSFSKCELGYIVESEGPQIPFVLGQGVSEGGWLAQEGSESQKPLKYNQDWSAWT